MGLTKLELPKGIESKFIQTSDGKTLEVWKLDPTPEEKKPYIGIIFHGNGGSLEDFLLTQLWFQELGITSYGFDYRGYGRSSGWPSENGIEIDSDEVWKFILNEEQVNPNQVLVCGVSLGTCPATRIASLHEPHLLILVASFTNVKDKIRDTLFLKPISKFAWYLFPTDKYIQAIRKTNVILLQGDKDNIFPLKHSKKLFELYKGSGDISYLTIPKAGHNNVFFLGWRILSEKVLEQL